MNASNFAFGALGIVIVGFLALRKYRKERRKHLLLIERLFVPASALLQGTQSGPGESAGSWVVSGTYRDAPFQLRTIIDTLATRKLPCLWLQVTLQREQDVPAKIDVMLRPAGLTSFSNFDFLPDTLPNPPNAPVDAVIKSDNAEAASLTMGAIGPHLKLLALPRAKELLVTPTGLRLVVQLSEANRVRYGVFRQADFEGAEIQSEALLAIMNGLLALEGNLRSDAKHG